MIYIQIDTSQFILNLIIKLGVGTHGICFFVFYIPLLLSEIIVQGIMVCLAERIWRLINTSVNALSSDEKQLKVMVKITKLAEGFPLLWITEWEKSGSLSLRGKKQLSGWVIEWCDIV